MNDERKTDWLVPFRGWDRASRDPRFFLRQGNIYISDQHAALSWAWLQHVRPEEHYQLIAMSRFNLSWHEENYVDVPYAELKELSLSEYYNLRAQPPSTRGYVVDDTNCLAVFLGALYDSIDWVHLASADYDPPSELKAKNFSTVSPIRLPNLLRSIVIEHAGQEELILHIDCGAFAFMAHDESEKLAFSSEYIEDVFSSLAIARDTKAAAAITIVFPRLGRGGEATLQRLAYFLRTTLGIIVPVCDDELPAGNV